MLEVSSIFPVGVACVLVPLSTTKEHYTALPCCTITGKDNQRLELRVPVLVQCPLGELISSAGQSCARDLPASALSSEFCTVQVPARPQNVSALRNSEVSAFWRAVKLNVKCKFNPDCNILSCIMRCPL